MNTAAGAFWVETAVYFMLCLNKEQNESNLFGLSGAIGLAVLTKGTAMSFSRRCYWPLGGRAAMWRA
jgi:hypothetical protein